MFSQYICSDSHSVGGSLVGVVKNVRVRLLTRNIAVNLGEKRVIGRSHLTSEMKNAGRIARVFSYAKIFAIKADCPKKWIFVEQILSNEDEIDEIARTSDGEKFGGFRRHFVKQIIHNHGGILTGNFLEEGHIGHVLFKNETGIFLAHAVEERLPLAYEEKYRPGFRFVQAFRAI